MSAPDALDLAPDPRGTLLSVRVSLLTSCPSYAAQDKRLMTESHQAHDFRIDFKESSGGSCFSQKNEEDRFINFP